MQILIIIIGLILIVVHGLAPKGFKVDAISVLILFILSIPLLAQYLKKAKLLGAEFEFKDRILEVKKLVQESTKKIEKTRKTTTDRKLPFETFKLVAIRALLDVDHTLALAALRIEIEKKMRLTDNFFQINKKHELPLSKLIESFGERNLLIPEQVEALQKIITMCNKAIHGSTISKEEATTIVDLTEELNKTFSIGYSVDISPNENYAQHNLFCEWEHCIELMPLSTESTASSCPMFGHNCPGGKEKASECENSTAISYAHGVEKSHG